MEEEGTYLDYVDEEFSSEHEHEAGGGEFADEDAVVDTTSVSFMPVGGEEEDADYAGEFDEDDTVIADSTSPSPTNIIGEGTMENTLTTANIEETEPYDGEFEEDDAEVAVPPNFDNISSTVQHAPNILPLGDEKSLKAPNDQTDENDNDDGEYSNDLEDDNPAATPENTILPRNPCDENATKRRSSVPIPIPDDILPKTVIVRADSLPKVLPAISLEKWMDTVPQELSPRRHDLARRPSSCFPVEEDPQQHNLTDEDKETDNDVAVKLVPSSIKSRVRARSYPNILQEKVVIPRRRAQSLLYIQSLPSVKETTTDEELEPERNQGDELYSDNEGSYGGDKHTSFESEHDNDEAKPAKDECPHPATTFDGALHVESNSLTIEPSTTPHVQSPLNEGNRFDPKFLQDDDDDYADEMDEDFPSDFSTPQIEGENTPHKSDEANDYDVDEFIEDKNHETDILLHEARALLELQQNEITDSEQTSSQQNATMLSEITPHSADTAAKMDQAASTLQNNNETETEKHTSPYDDDDDFADSDEWVATEDHDRVGKYDTDADEFEDNAVTVDGSTCTEVAALEKSKEFVVSETVDVSEDAKPTGENTSGNNSEATTANETIAASPLNDVAAKTNASPTQPPETSQSNDPSPVTIAVKQEGKKVATVSKEPTKPNRSTPQHVRPKPPVKNVASTPKQPSQHAKASRPPAKRAIPVPPLASSPTSVDVKPATAPRPYRNKIKTATPDCQTTASSFTGSSGETTTSTPKPSPTGQTSSPQTNQKVSSPRHPSNACPGPYQHVPNEYQQVHRKEAVPKQSSKPSSRGEQGGKRCHLQPVRTPANLRFNLPKMDKTKRDWLFVNMFRHGDDLSKYEAFVPSNLLVRPPTNHSKETKSRPLSAHHVYGTPQTSRFVSPSRKLVPQPNTEIQDRERNWVATTPHDSKLPSYDSILDKYCTAVTNPMVQRQIYQTRHRDLSPQLAFVLEKRVEKSCRKGFYDSFGGVRSYKTEVVPTSPRQISSHTHTKSGILERHTTSPGGHVTS